MRTDTPGWAQYYLGIATEISKKSKDSTQVGALLLSPQGAIILTAYNGPPKGVRDLPERFERENGVKYLFAQHAERNLIDFAARHGIRTEGCTVVCTHAPCATCAGSLIQAGIGRVAYGPGQTSMPIESFDAARTMFEEAGVLLLTPYQIWRG